MAVDPSDPDTFDQLDRFGESAADGAGGDERAERAEHLDEEVPEADAAEQHTEVSQRRDDPLIHIDPDTANEADAVEQARVVTIDEDDYR
ncbi:hypothetical protein ACWF94_38155 [Streptomyces sp. NPDC055078]